MFNFSANHLLLLSRTEYRSCAVFLLQDHSTRRVYRLYDFTKSLALEANIFYCVARKVHRRVSLRRRYRVASVELVNIPVDLLRERRGQGEASRRARRGIAGSAPRRPENAPADDNLPAARTGRPSVSSR